MDPVMPFDACTIWCIYDFHKRIMMLLRASMLLNLIGKCQWASKTEQGSYSARNSSSPSQPCLPRRLDLPQQTFPGSAPKDIGLLIFSLAISVWHELQITILPSCHQLPPCEQHRMPPWAFGRKWDAQYQQGVKGTESTSTIFPLPEHGSRERLGRDSRDTMGLYFTEQDQSGCHTQHGT